MQYDGQWFRDRRHGNGTLTIEAAGKVLYTYDGQWQAAAWWTQASVAPHLGQATWEWELRALP